MKRLLPYVIVTLLAFALGVAVVWGLRRADAPSVEEQSTVLLSQIERVSKLVTVEGDLLEVFDRKEDRNVTFYLPLPTKFTFRKEALVEVTGKVLVGYDLSEMSVDVDQKTRTVRLGNLPTPEILAIDHEVKYRNLEESWFNEFTADDYTVLNRRAKERLREAALRSNLMQAAEDQGNAVVETIRFLVEGAGFELVVERPARG